MERDPAAVQRRFAGWTCRPDDVSPAQLAEPRTPKQVWAKIVSEKPDLYSFPALRNGNGSV